MVRRWHCHSCPWRFCLVTDTRMIRTDHPAGFPGASLVPGPAAPPAPSTASSCQGSDPLGPVPQEQGVEQGGGR